jgi:hypothetical protein
VRDVRAADVIRMKHSNLKFLAAGILLALGAGCSSQEEFALIATEKAPAAEGVVTVDAGEPNENSTLNISVENLAPPDRLTPPAATYVVWAKSAETPEAKPINLGALDVDSEALDGELETLTPLRQFELFITAEASAEVTEPTGDPVLLTTVNIIEED